MKKLYLLLVFSLVFIFQDILHTQELSPEQIFKKVNDAIVIVYAYNDNGGISQGSGFYIDKNIIVTNYHVYAGCKTLKIKHYDTEITDLKIIGFSVSKDILIIETGNESNNFLMLANSDSVITGQKVYAIGSPKGYENSISEGIISGKERFIALHSNMLQMTANISHGSSGGAVVNSKGEVIGISTAGMAEDNLYFAIPINELSKIKRKYYNNLELDASYELFKGFIYTFRGKLLIDFETAIDCIENYLKVFPNDDLAYYFMGLNKYVLKKYEDAIKDYLKVLSLNPFHRWYYYEDIEKQTNNSNRKRIDILADSLYKISNKIIKDESNSQYYTDRGVVYLLLKCNERAIDDFNFSINLNANYARAYYYRGYANYNLNKYNNSISDWENAIKHNPDYNKELKAEINKIKSNK